MPRVDSGSTDNLERAKSLVIGVGVVAVLIGTAGIRIATDVAWIKVFDNLHWTASTSATAVLAWLAFLQQRKGGDRVLFRWLAIGFTGYAIGQWCWDIQTAVAYDGFPAPSDLFYLWLGPCAVLGLTSTFGQLNNQSVKQTAFLDTLTIALALLTLTLVLYLPKRGDTDVLSLAVLIAYPVTLFSVVATLVVMVPTLRIRVTLSWACFGAGFLVTAMSWMYWNFLALDGTTIDGSWFNVSFSFAILAIGYSLTRWEMDIHSDPVWARRCEGFLRQMPLISVTVAALAVVLSHTLANLPTFVQHFSDAGCVGVIVMAMMRQGLLLEERDQLIAAQAALSRSQDELVLERGQLKTLVKTIPDLVWLKDADGRYLSCNPAFERLYGADEKTIIGKTDFDFVSKNRAELFRENDRLAVAEGKARVNEEQLTFASDGYSGTFETVKTPMRDESGNLIGVLGISRDISQRKSAESQLRIHSNILANLVEGIHLVSCETLKIVFTNPQLDRLFGYKDGELLGAPVAILNAPDEAASEGLVDKVLASLELAGTWEGDVKNVRKDGSMFWSHAVVSSFDHPEHGKVWISVHEDVTGRKQAEDAVRTLAFYDPLTRLPNRRMMQDRMRLALAGVARTEQAGALMLIDLDNFKTLNDTMGHAAGDQLLIGAAERLLGCLREGDTVARLGGDEFVVILTGLEPGATGAATAKLVADKIQEALATPYSLNVRRDDGHQEEYTSTFQCTSSIGITMFAGSEHSADELLKLADTAMYQAKRAGRNTACFYDPRIQEAIQARAQLEADLLAAVVENQFVLYFQPQVSEQGRTLGAEVLLRWNHPKRGLVSPAEFIPLAEETGLILPIGHAVLVNACSELARWQERPGMKNLNLSVNVSALQISMPTFVEEVVQLLDHTKIDPGLLKLELTESMLLNKTEEVIAKMTELRRHGVRFSLDDFGTGYSSLSYLKRLPLDQLKIDQSFVRDLLIDPNDAAIARAVITLGHSLGLNVIAEGVETLEQSSALFAAGCDAFQGYYYGRPMPLEEFEDHVLRRSGGVDADPVAAR